MECDYRVASNDNEEGRTSIFAVSVAFILLLIVESAIHLAVLRGSPNLRAVAVLHGHWLMLLCAFAPFLFLRRLPKGKAIALGLGTIAFIYAAIVTTRGNWIWPGTYDKYLSSFSCALPLFVGTATGILFICIAGWKKAFTPTLETCFISVGSLAVLSVLSFFEAQALPLDSAFPFTRVYFGVSLALMLLISTLITSRNE